MTTESESSELGQESNGCDVTSYDIILTRWLPEERHLRKYVRHRTFEQILVKISNLICEFLLVKKRYLIYYVYYDSVVFIYLSFHCLDLL